MTSPSRASYVSAAGPGQQQQGGVGASGGGYGLYGGSLAPTSGSGGATRR